MHEISVSIVYALAEQQWLKEMTVPRGTSTGDLLEQSGFLNDIEEFKGVEIDDIMLGVYSQKVSPDTLLEDGDRVEIYRPLTADPKEVRRQLALLGKTIGNKK